MFIACSFSMSYIFLRHPPFWGASSSFPVLTLVALPGPEEGKAVVLAKASSWGCSGHWQGETPLCLGPETPTCSSAQLCCEAVWGAGEEGRGWAHQSLLATGPKRVPSLLWHCSPSTAQ